MSRRAWSCLLVVVVVGTSLLAIFPSPGVAATAMVGAGDYAFSPASRTVHVGDTVVWRFSGETHTVTGGLLNSGFRTGGTYSFTFAQPGKYPYVCEIHVSLGMKGTITVLAAAATPRLTPRPTPRATPRPTPRPTPTPTRPPLARPSPLPSPVSTPTPTPTPSLVAAVSATPSPASSPAAISPVATVSVEPSPVTTPAATAPVQGDGGSLASSAVPFVAVGALLVIALLGWTLVRARRRR